MIGPGAVSTGIDIGTGHISAAEVRRGRSGERVVRCARFARVEIGDAPGAEEWARAARILARRGFDLRDVVVSLAPGSACSRLIEIPDIEDRHAMDEIVAGELARINQWEPGTFEAASWPVVVHANRGERRHAMTVACPHERSDAQLDLLEQWCGVRALDAPGLTLMRMCARAAPGRDAMLCRIEASDLFVVFVRDSRLMYEREVGLGGSADSPAPGGRALHERCAAELASSLEFFRRRHDDFDLTQTLLTGAPASNAGLIDAIEHALHVPVRSVVPSNLVSWDDRVQGAGDPGISCAVAVALFGRGA